MTYIIGIDLGTTNSCVGYIDTRDPNVGVQIFNIVQVAPLGTIDSFNTLPSFCYLPAEQDLVKGEINVPWNTQRKVHQDYVVGKYAASAGAKTPTRLVQSAKSWLCHPAASRKDKILPVVAASDEIRISPVEATARYLRHIREAWNDTFAKRSAEADFDMQQVILTVPASFDEVARTLTIEAAKKADYKHVVLLEEPQAAFYSWIASHEKEWHQKLNPGDQVLVCDVGGGTTDFTLIEVVESEGVASFVRQAVGDHLLLGGDNMDAALAHYIEGKLIEEHKDLSAIHHSQIVHQARLAKEDLLGSGEHETYKIVLQGRGSGIIQNTLTMDISKQEITDLLMQGFFTFYPWEEALKLRQGSAIRSMGLPYESEPSIIKQLASFLNKTRSSTGLRPPTHLLLNGGAMKPLIFQNAIIEALGAWFPKQKVTKLESYNLDLAVARGAAYYGKARQGLGVKIGGGLSRNYYLLLDMPDGEKKALCLLPRGCEEGTNYEPQNTFLLTPNTPIAFTLATSQTRREDASGDLITINPEEIHILPSMQTVMRYGKGASQSQDKIPVHIQIALTAIGTIEIHLKAINSTHRWQLDFQVRSVSGQEEAIQRHTIDSNETFDVSILKDVEKVLEKTYGSRSGELKPEKVIENIEKLVSIPKNGWSSSLLRSVVDYLLKHATKRKESLSHETRWWNLVGYGLRPGYGFPLDDFRIKELWKIILSDIKTPSSQEVAMQHCVAIRRIAGGLNRGQQVQVAAELAKDLTVSGKWDLKGKKGDSILTEKIRALGSMELLDLQQKIKLGQTLVGRIVKGEASEAEVWTLGRIGARHLLHASLANVVPPHTCMEWIAQLLPKIHLENATARQMQSYVDLFNQLARKSTHREINLPDSCREQILQKFPEIEDLRDTLYNDLPFSQAQAEASFGESLPSGLSLINED